MSDQDVWEMQLKAALMLVQEFRFKVMTQKIDPRASRVALKFALKVDDHTSKQHGLTAEEDKALDELAQKMFEQTRKIDQARGEKHG